MLETVQETLVCLTTMWDDLKHHCVVLNIFWESILHFFTVGKLTRPPLLDLFSRKPQEENRGGETTFSFERSDSWTGACISVWICMDCLSSKFKIFFWKILDKYFFSARRVFTSRVRKASHFGKIIFPQMLVGAVMSLNCANTH